VIEQSTSLTSSMALLVLVIVLVLALIIGPALAWQRLSKKAS
jgi:hypothetical protein